MKRACTKQIIKDLNKKMVFIVGPRQVGKTWLSLEVSKKFNNATYLNYDSFEDRKIIDTASWHRDTELLIIDELHKKPKWKNYIKGIYDTKPRGLKILITGSARLDMLRQSGDSLAGRYFTHHLMPFTLSELKFQKKKYSIDYLINRGGFPEPLLADNDNDVRRWRQHYIDGLIRNDVLDFERVHELRKIQTIFEILRRRVGTPTSFASMARDVNLSPTTVIKYVKILEALYIIFLVIPYTKNIARTILKEPKIYFYDNGLVVGDEGACLENFAAVSLLKHVLSLSDYRGENHELKYIRTRDGREVDFCLVLNDTVKTLIEVKASDNKLSRNLKYFTDRYSVQGVQIVKNIKHNRTIENIDIINAQKYLKNI